ncbi:cadherin-23 [Trichonephila clavata]|uniref:Cadherin-23 n=1 Tax=Trichonephila clavata TaxID=2740835 RepID=A0A8X6I001_TRICU|nr:cadherin-23 [Trichonephila clavata]
MKYISLVFVISSLLTTTCSGQINRPPEFVKGGDMDKFSLKEDTLVGSSVYTLRARILKILVFIITSVETLCPLSGHWSGQAHPFTGQRSRELCRGHYQYNG